MCKAFDEMMQDSKAEGLAEGKAESRMEIYELLQKFKKAGHEQELIDALNDDEKVEELRRKYGI